MSIDVLAVFGLLALVIWLFARGRPSMDIAALIAMVALPLTGVISVKEALAGFSDPNIVLIAGLFIIGEGLVRTGVAQRLGEGITAAAGGSEARLLALLMVAVAGMGSFMSSTGVVAIFIPIALRVARQMNIAPGRLMMPLSMAALISGMMTLVATAPNLVVNAELIRRGYEGFEFFAFTPFGLPLLALAVTYMLYARRHLVGAEPAPAPARPGIRNWIDEFGLARREARLRVSPASGLAGQRLDSLNLRSSAGINILGIERQGRLGKLLIRPQAHTELEVGDILLIDTIGKAVGPDAGLDAVRAIGGLEDAPQSGTYFLDRSQEIGMAEAMVAPGSCLHGQTPVDAKFRSVHDLSIVAVKRGATILDGPAAAIQLQTGDLLLLAGPWRAIRRLKDERRNLLLLDLPEEENTYTPARSKAPHAVVILTALIAVLASGILPAAQAVLIACLAMGFFGCIDSASGYRSLNWRVLVLIVGMLPFALALERTGGIDMAATGIISLFGEAHPQAVVAALFAVTAVIGLFISNTATAVLMGPVALSIAETLGLSPYPFAMTVALAASAAFMTPVSSPVNTLVMGPGGYRFSDFVRIGVPFALLSMAVTTLLIPILLPF